jgi:hypothetical protein
MPNGRAVTPDELNTTVRSSLAFLAPKKATRLHGDAAEANIVICCVAQHVIVI